MNALLNIFPEHRSSSLSGERAHCAPAVALAAKRAVLPDELTPAPTRPDVRGPCEGPAAFLMENERGKADDESATTARKRQRKSRIDSA